MIMIISFLYNYLACLSLRLFFGPIKRPFTATGLQEWEKETRKEWEKQTWDKGHVTMDMGQGTWDKV